MSLLWYRVLCQNRSRRDAWTDVLAELCKLSNINGFGRNTASGI